ncbi:MAG: hypothetical protein WC108_04440 [Bacteroidales bacterium]
MNELIKLEVNAENRVETVKPLLGALFLIFGIGIILFSNWGGGVNPANILLGLFLGILGVSISMNERDVIGPKSKVEEVNQSSTENKQTLGNHVTIVEEVITRKVKNESM